MVLNIICSDRIENEMGYVYIYIYVCIYTYICIVSGMKYLYRLGMRHLNFKMKEKGMVS